MSNRGVPFSTIGPPRPLRLHPAPVSPSQGGLAGAEQFQGYALPKSRDPVAAAKSRLAYERKRYADGLRATDPDVTFGLGRGKGKPKTVKPPQAPAVGLPENMAYPSAGYFRLRRYGITEDEYQAMLAAQDHSCAICHTLFSEVKKVCVDHCHDTKVVRGLLCDNCNVGLGRFRDDLQLVAAAADYLRARQS